MKWSVRVLALIATALFFLPARPAAAEADAKLATSSIEEFQKAAEAGKTDAREVARLTVLAVVVWHRDVALSEQMLSVLLESDDREEDSSSPTGFRPRRSVKDDLARMAGKPEIGAAYCGATPEAGYADGDLLNCPVRFATDYSPTRQGVGYPSEDRAKFFMQHSGGRPRPIELILVDGRWRIRNFGGLLSGVSRKS